MTGSNEQMGESEKAPDGAQITAAIARLSAGGLVVVPTETVYGLAADATSAAAVAAIYRAKGRPEFNPLIVHAVNREMAEQLADFNSLAIFLADQFWPGPLTLVLPQKADSPVTPAVTAGLDTIALRCPAHPLMQRLLTDSGLFLAAPSANRSGSISPTLPAHVASGLGSDAPMILDGGPCAQGLESTIVAVRGPEYEILRPGPVTQTDLIAATGKEPVFQDRNKIEAPGQLAAHYAPSKPVRLNADRAEPGEFLIGFGETAGDYNLSENADLAEAAARLFKALHVADADDHRSIAVVPIPDLGIGSAINDRLRRASTDS